LASLVTLPVFARLVDGPDVVAPAAGAMLLLTLAKRLEANRRPLPPAGPERRRVVVRRLLLDRDTASHEGWIRRQPDKEPASDETLMRVTCVRLAYNGRSSHSADRVAGMVHVRDANMAAVPGPLVAATWTKPDLASLETTAVTDFQGIATFGVWAGSGEYRLCVTDVTLEGWLYDPEENLETCGVLVIQWPFNPPR
jgi:hypothetical protein